MQMHALFSFTPLYVTIFFILLQGFVRLDVQVSIIPHMVLKITAQHKSSYVSICIC